MSTQNFTVRINIIISINTRENWNKAKRLDPKRNQQIFKQISLNSENVPWAWCLQMNVWEWRTWSKQQSAKSPSSNFDSRPHVQQVTMCWTSEIILFLCTSQLYSCIHLLHSSTNSNFCFLANKPLCKNLSLPSPMSFMCPMSGIPGKYVSGYN